MKVLLVTENLGSGGAERQLVGLASLLKRAGHEPIVVTWVDKNFYAEALARCGIYHILLSPRCKAHRIWLLKRLFARERPHAVISFLPAPNETCALASIFSPVKLIVSERSLTTKWGFRRKLTNLLYRRATYIVANSNNEADNLRRHLHKMRNRISAIPNFVDLHRFSFVERSAPRGRKIRLVSVGRVIPSKNILTLLRAVATLRQQGIDLDYKWYGATYDREYLAAVTEEIVRHGLTDCFHLMGETTDIIPAYAEADFFCLPSLLEGYPNVLVEAMATGLPVVASAVCEHPFIISNGENGYLFNPYDSVDIARAIQALVNSSDSELTSMACNNRVKVMNNNTEDAFLRQYLVLMQ